MNERAQKAARLLGVWCLALFLSSLALLVSLYTFGRDQVNHSCVQHGHFYEPRFNAVPPRAEEVNKLGFEWESRRRLVIEKLTRRIYVRDVCRYCGSVVNPEPVERSGR